MQLLVVEVPFENKVSEKYLVECMIAVAEHTVMTAVENSVFRDFLDTAAVVVLVDFQDKLYSVAADMVVVDEPVDTAVAETDVVRVFAGRSVVAGMVEAEFVDVAEALIFPVLVVEWCMFEVVDGVHVVV